MDVATFQKEDRKYSCLYRSNYKDAHWQKLAKVVLAKLKSTNERVSLIDLGFGRGAALDFFEGNDFSVEGIEISSYAVKQQRENGRKVYHASLDDLSMLRNNQFYIGFSNDVLEHIPKDIVGKSLEEMVRVCSNYLFVSVCPTPSHHLSFYGENLHLTVRPLKWWEQQFRKYGEVEKLRFWFSRSGRYIINLNSKNNHH